MLGFGLSIEPQLWTLLFVMVRIGAAFIAAPVFGAVSVPLPVRITLSGAIAVLVMGVHQVAPPAQVFSIVTFLAVGMEALTGLAIGFILQIAFAAPLTGQYEIWKAFVQAPGVLTDYTQLTQGAPNQPARAPAWSSDSNWIIFQRDVDPGAGADQRLFVVQADGAKVRALNVAGVAPAWQGGGVAPALPPLPNRLYLPAVRR